jgi:hypothetical protein
MNFAAAFKHLDPKFSIYFHLKPIFENFLLIISHRILNSYLKCFIVHSQFFTFVHSDYFIEA